MKKRDSERRNIQIYNQLREAYQSDFGQSAQRLCDSICSNNGDSRDISERTVRDVLNDEDKFHRSRETTLNLICKALLGKSYLELAKEVDDDYEEIQHDEVDIDRTIEKKSFAIYIKRLTRELDRVRVPGMSSSKNLLDLYTEARVYDEVVKRTEKDLKTLAAEFSGGGWSQNRLDMLGEPFKERQLNLLDAIETFQYLQIWGTAGGGKTTALKLAGLHFASEFSLEDGDSKLPIFVDLGRFAQIEKTQDLLGHIEERFLRFSESEDREQAIEAFYSLLKAGRCILLLDGLDEIPNQHALRVQNQIQELVERFYKNAFVMTCRFGARRHPAPEFQEVQIVDLDKTRIEQYIEKWFKSEAAEQDQFADEIPDAELFRRSLWSNQPVLELAKTPLLLTIMCQLYSSGREFPKDRNALFDDASELFIRNWDAWKKVARSSRSDDSHGGHHSLSNTNRKLLLARIAYKGFQSPSGVQFSWEGEELNEIIQEFMKNVSGFRKESQKIESREMLRTIEFQNGLLIKHDVNNYRFSHLAFQESFAAQEMKESLTLEQIIEQVDLHIDDPAWHTTFKNLVAKIRKLQDTAAILRRIFYHMNLGVKDSKEIQGWLTWLTNMTARANVQTPSWRSCIAAFDNQTFLNTDPSSIPEDVQELAYPIAANLREINISSYQITPRTPLCQLQLDLAVAHTVAHNLSQGESEKVRFISGYDPRYESLETSESSSDILVSFDRLFSNIVELAEKEQSATMDVKESLPVLKKLQLSRPKSTQEQKDWADWAATLASTMQMHYGTGTGAKLSKEDQAALSRYTRLTSLLSECLQDDIYCSPDDRRMIFDHLFLPHHKIPSELTTLSDSRQVALSK